MEERGHVEGRVHVVEESGREEWPCRRGPM